MALSSEIEVAPLQDDFSGGIRSRVSVVGLGGRTKCPNFVKDAVNAHWRPKRGFGIRGGSRDISTVALPQKPTSIGKFYHSGANKLFLGTDDGAGAGKLYRMTQTGVTEQTLSSFTMTNAKLSFAMANGILVVTQIGATAPPQFYSTLNPSETWYSLALPKPVAAPTFGADQAGGSLTPTVSYYYRVRWVYVNGASATSPVSAAADVVAASGNYKIRVNIPQPGSPRTDYVGWILERTLQDGDATGPFQRVTQQLAAVTTWDDGAADSTLDYESDETIHGEPPAMDGVIYHKGRLWGWKGSAVYISQVVIGSEESTGVCNWLPDPYYLDAEDGDTIQGCVKQGDRLLFGKRRSLHVIEGIDVDSFILRRIYAGVGFAGPRSFLSLGPTVFFYAGAGRMFVNRGGDATDPVWSEELGDQLAMMDPTYDADVLGVNDSGERALFWHRRKDSTSQRDIIGWDLLEGNAVRFRDPPAIDALSQDGDSDFGGATLMLADPTLHAPAVTTSPGTNPSFFVWRDARGASTEVYAQSLDNLGAARYATNGVQVGNSTGSAQTLTSAICGDGSGGFIVAYLDNRSGSRLDLYAQRYNAAGTALWVAGGVRVSNGTAALLAGHVPAICSDGLGGAVVLWTDGRFNAGFAAAFLAQRLDAADGSSMWTAGGVVLYNQLDGAYSPNGYVDQSSRPLVVRCGVRFLAIWQLTGGATNVRHQVISLSGSLLESPMANLTSCSRPKAAVNGTTGWTISVQSNSTGETSVRQLNTSGATLWTTIADAGRPASGIPRATQLVADGAGGVIAIWQEFPAANQYQIRAQRLTSAGVLAWATGGIVAIQPQAGILALQSAVMNGSGGAIFGYTVGTAPHAAYVQNVDSSGIPAWGTGVQLRTSDAGDTNFPTVCTDGVGGCIAMYWHLSTDLRAQRVDTAGFLQWGTAGVPIVTATGVQDLFSSCFTDTPETEYPPTATAGYHVWAAFEGVTDFADSAGANGTPIYVEVDGHRHTCGLPNYTKRAERITLYTNRGTGTFSITVTGDEGRLAALSLEASSQAVKYNSGAKYNDGSKYATTGQSTISRGIRPTVKGRGLAVTFRGTFTEELEIGGWELEALALPDRRMS